MVIWRPSLFWILSSIQLQKLNDNNLSYIWIVFRAHELPKLSIEKQKRNQMMLSRSLYSKPWTNFTYCPIVNCHNFKQLFIYWNFKNYVYKLSGCEFESRRSLLLTQLVPVLYSSLHQLLQQKTLKTSEKQGNNGSMNTKWACCGNQYFPQLSFIYSFLFLFVCFLLLLFFVPLI